MASETCRHCAPRRHRSVVRPLLESLEERTLPSVDFRLGQQIRLPITAPAYSPAKIITGDFSGDGNLDLAYAGDYGGGVILGNGDGAFGAPISSPAVAEIGDLASGDFNRDGQLDLVALVTPRGGSGGMTVSGIVVLLGTGNGTFRTGSTYVLSSWEWEIASALAVGDFTGDAISDLAIPLGNNGEVVLLQGYGDGTFQVPPPPDGSVQQPASYRWGGAYELSPADLNGDGWLDLVIGSFDGVRVLRNNAAGGFLPAVAYSAELVSRGSIALADFTGDGKLDLVTHQLDGTLSLWSSNGDGTFAPPRTIAARTGGGIAIADFDADGRQDIAFCGATGVSLHAVTVLSANGDGTFTSTILPFPGDENPTIDEVFAARTLVAGDFDGTGKPGLAVGGGQWLRWAHVTILLPASSATTTAVSASADEFVGGQPVTFTAVVTGTAGTPTGNVTFLATTGFLGTAPLKLVNGVTQATFTSDALRWGGDYTIAAVYGWDRERPDAPISFSTTKVTAFPFFLGASINSVAEGQPMTFRARVSSVVMAGEITFLDGDSVLGTVALSLDDEAREAMFTTPSLAPGTHTITAVYNSDVPGRKQLRTTTRVTVSNSKSGVLDPTFGTGGVVTSPSFTAPNKSFAIQPDGRFLELGADWGGPSFVLRRLNPDGSLDAEFGAGGTVSVFSVGLGLLSETGNASSREWAVNATTLAIQPDGKILVAGGYQYDSYSSCPRYGLGACQIGIPLWHPFVARFNSDGTIDTSFGDNGAVVTKVGRHAWIDSIAVQPDGKIVAAGSADVGLALVRYDADGSLDAGFGRDGVARAAFGAVVPWQGVLASGLAIQQDGKIVVAGSYFNPDRHQWENRDIALTRFNSDGSLDAAFGAGGIVKTPLGEGSRTHGIAIQPNGAVVVLATVKSSPIPFTPARPDERVTLVRYTPDGHVDPAFADSGYLFTDIQLSRGTPYFSLQPGGGIIVTASQDVDDPARMWWGISTKIVLERYTSDGTLDLTFGDHGRVATNLGRDMAYPTGMALDAEGRIVVAAGQLARFLNEFPAPVDPSSPPGDASNLPADTAPLETIATESSAHLGTSDSSPGRQAGITLASQVLMQAQSIALAAAWPGLSLRSPGGEVEPPGLHSVQPRPPMEWSSSRLRHGSEIADENVTHVPFAGPLPDDSSESDASKDTAEPPASADAEPHAPATTHRDVVFEAWPEAGCHWQPGIASMYECARVLTPESEEVRRFNLLAAAIALAGGAILIQDARSQRSNRKDDERAPYADEGK